MKRSRATTQRVSRAMKDKSVKQPKTIPQEVKGRTPRGWAPIQKSIAESAGIAMLLIEGYQPPALAIANNNSICEALQSSPDHVGLCDPFAERHTAAQSVPARLRIIVSRGFAVLAMPSRLTAGVSSQ